MECNLVVGQKVVFVLNPNPTDFDMAAREEWLRRGLKVPEDGKIYTIRAIRMAFNSQYGYIPGVLLSEIRNPKQKLKGGGFDEPTFHHKSFHPIVTRKTDISVFKAMLNPSKVKEVVGA